jgi:hypothetical protein
MHVGRDPGDTAATLRDFARKATGIDPRRHPRIHDAIYARRRAGLGGEEPGKTRTAPKPLTYEFVQNAAELTSSAPAPVGHNVEVILRLSITLGRLLPSARRTAGNSRRPRGSGLVMDIPSVDATKPGSLGRSLSQSVRS